MCSTNTFLFCFYFEILPLKRENVLLSSWHEGHKQVKLHFKGPEAYRGWEPLCLKDLKTKKKTWTLSLSAASSTSTALLFFLLPALTSEIRALLTSLRRTNCTKAGGGDTSEENVHRFALWFQFHVLISDATNKWSPEEDEEPVVPAGTRPHNAPSVLPGEWESTTVAMFVTSSYGHILH